VHFVSPWSTSTFPIAAATSSARAVSAGQQPPMAMSALFMLWRV
jgi:hypothetical protein